MSLDATVIHQQLQDLAEQRDKATQTFHQCLGAISILQEQLQYTVQKEREKVAQELVQQANDALIAESADAATMDSSC